jgi:hypothetical protein
MSYREENGQVVLTMSREDFNLLLMMLGTATAATVPDGVLKSVPILVYPRSRSLALLNRLNEGNPNYTPYELATSPADGGQGPGLRSPNERDT